MDQSRDHPSYKLICLVQHIFCSDFALIYESTVHGCHEVIPHCHPGTPARIADTRQCIHEVRSIVVLPVLV